MNKRSGEQRYEPDQPHGSGGQFAKVAHPRPPHGGPESGHPVKPGQAPSPPPVVPTKSEFGPKGPPGAPQPASPTSQSGQPTPLPPGLSPDQQSAVEAWLGPQQPDINAEAASRNVGAFNKVVQDLESAILEAPALGHDQIAYLGLPPTDLSKLLKPHTVINRAGFTPCSSTPLPPSTRAIEVTVPRGSKALELPGELLLPRGARIRIDDVPQTGNVGATYIGGSERPASRSAGPDKLAHYRSLWFRARSREEREDILAAVRRLQQGL